MGSHPTTRQLISSSSFHEEQLWNVSGSERHVTQNLWEQQQMKNVARPVKTWMAIEQTSKAHLKKKQQNSFEVMQKQTTFYDLQEHSKITLIKKASCQFENFSLIPYIYFSR